ncbi:hypothetical protein DFH08DRAFT_163715 [Mycena albidolilacea]|uniref:Uncharacterized protein n=1 Tax=Mycena albidolilacea TaxID=1033008 RepID=A0AAD7AQI9_9AGAR|nr:hypothetical protein DFH08DRAFT_163715 [Mycena albidolilacea]
MRLSTVAFTVMTLLALTRAAPVRPLKRDTDAAFSWDSASPDQRIAYLEAIDPHTVTLEECKGWLVKFQAENASSGSQNPSEAEGQQSRRQSEKGGEQDQSEAGEQADQSGADQQD